MVPSVEQEIRDLHELFGSSRDPEGRAFVPLADAYRRAGDLVRSLELLDEGLRRHPRLPAAHLVEALTRVDLYDLAGAEAAFRRVLEADPDNARALVGLGRLLGDTGDDAGEADELMRRGLDLDPMLEGDVAAPRAGGLAEAASDAPSVAEVASLLEWDLAPAVDDGPGPVDAPDGPLPVPDEATPPEAAAGHDGPSDERIDEPADVLDPADLAPSEVLDVDELDIEWETDGFYEAPAAEEPSEGSDERGGPEEVADTGDLGGVGGIVDIGGGEEVVGGEPDGAELVLDAASLAPDGWQDDDDRREEGGPAAGPGALPTGDVDAGDLLMELADLAPDIEPGSRPEDDEPPDEVLPTRTLGELYARQGLVGEAVKVFEELVRHSPSDTGLQARLAELRAGASPAAHERDESTIAEFLEGLLAWESTPGDDGAAAG